jgi:hypothetical protein
LSKKWSDFFMLCKFSIYLTNGILTLVIVRPSHMNVCCIGMEFFFGSWYTKRNSFITQSIYAFQRKSQYRFWKLSLSWQTNGLFIDVYNGDGTKYLKQTSFVVFKLFRAPISFSIDTLTYSGWILWIVYDFWINLCWNRFDSIIRKREMLKWLSWEICDGRVSNLYVQFNSNTWSEGILHTTEINVSLFIFVLLSERWRRDINFVIEDESLFSSKLSDNKRVWSGVNLEIVSFNSRWQYVDCIR